MIRYTFTIYCYCYHFISIPKPPNYDWNQAEDWRGFGGRPGYGDDGSIGRDFNNDRGGQWRYDFGGYQSGYNNFGGDQTGYNDEGNGWSYDAGGYWGSGIGRDGGDAAGARVVKPSLGMGRGAGPGLLDYPSLRSEGLDFRGASVSSIGDLVNVAKDRTTSDLWNTPTGMAVRDWQACVKVSSASQPDSALHNSLQAANVSLLPCVSIIHGDHY